MSAFQRLKAISELFFFREWPHYPIKPRLVPLIAGPSGAGKSHLVRALGQELGMKIIKVSPSSWIPAGVRDSVQTLTKIHEFVTGHDLGIIHADELDKFYQSGSGDFSRHCRGEAFDLLDGTISKTDKDASWNSATLAKLRSSFLIVGSGTWQSIWSQPDRPNLGFGPLAAKPDKAEQIRKDNSIPEELLRRFHSEIFLIHPPRQKKNLNLPLRSLGSLRSPENWAIGSTSLKPRPLGMACVGWRGNSPNCSFSRRHRAGPTC